MRTCKYILSAYFICFIIAGCTATTPIGPGNIYKPDERERRLWDSATEAELALAHSGKLYRDPQLEKYLQSVLEKLLGNNLPAYLPLTPKVYILDSPVVNAFALPQGAIFVHTGILGRIRNEAQLASLLGHEITHSTHRHADQKLKDAYARTGVACPPTLYQWLC